MRQYFHTQIRFQPLKRIIAGSEISTCPELAAGNNTAA